MMTIVVVVLLAAAFDSKWAGPVLTGATTVSQSQQSHTSGKIKQKNDDDTTHSDATNVQVDTQINQGIDSDKSNTNLNVDNLLQAKFDQDQKSIQETAKPGAAPAAEKKAEDTTLNSLDSMFADKLVDEPAAAAKAAPAAAQPASGAQTVIVAAAPASPQGAQDAQPPNSESQAQLQAQQIIDQMSPEQL